VESIERNISAEICRQQKGALCYAGWKIAKVVDMVSQDPGTGFKGRDPLDVNPVAFSEKDSHDQWDPAIIPGQKIAPELVKGCGEKLVCIAPAGNDDPIIRDDLPRPAESCQRRLSTPGKAQKQHTASSLNDADTMHEKAFYGWQAHCRDKVDGAID
jgi:hypothetical protein